MPISQRRQRLLSSQGISAQLPEHREPVPSRSVFCRADRPASSKVQGLEAASVFRSLRAQPAGRAYPCPRRQLRLRDLRLRLASSFGPTAAREFAPRHPSTNLQARSRKSSPNLVSSDPRDRSRSTALRRERLVVAIYFPRSP